jgi:hypothetical protein
MCEIVCLGWRRVETSRRNGMLVIESGNLAMMEESSVSLPPAQIAASASDPANAMRNKRLRSPKNYRYC